MINTVHTHGTQATPLIQVWFSLPSQTSRWKIPVELINYKFH